MQFEFRNLWLEVQIYFFGGTFKVVKNLSLFELAAVVIRKLRIKYLFGLRVTVGD